MTGAELQAFSAQCKREGILFSAAGGGGEALLDKKKEYAVVCRKDDAERMAKLVDRLNDEKLIENLERRANAIKGKAAEAGSALTERDAAELVSITREIDGIRRGHCHDLNDEQARAVTERAIGEPNEKQTAAVSFDAALDRKTGGYLDKDTETYIADAANPDNHIKCHGQAAEYNGKPYIKTDYEAYNKGAKVYATHDGRFDNRPRNYWQTEKSKLKNIGGVGDTVLKFNSYEEYKRYAENFQAQKRAELDVLHAGAANRDYASIRAELEKQLSQRGGVLENGVVMAKNADKPLLLADGMTGAERANIAEAHVIGRQIACYERLESLSAELAIANARVLTADTGTAEHDEAAKAAETLRNSYDTRIMAENSLLESRKLVNSVQADIETREARDDEIEYFNDANKSAYERYGGKNGGGLDNGDGADIDGDGKADGANRENGGNARAMESYRAEIERERAKAAESGKAQTREKVKGGDRDDWHRELTDLQREVKPYLDAIRKFPQRLRELVNSLFPPVKQQEQTQEIQPQRKKNHDIGGR
jgi:hypothetical protein